MTPDQFWALTMREFYRELVTFKRRQKDEWDRTISAAWWREWMHRQKTLPRLSELLARAEHKGQTPAQQQAMWQLIGDTFGLKSRKHDPNRIRIVRHG